jgi:hypothetical protein
VSGQSVGAGPPMPLPLPVVQFEITIEIFPGGS